MQETWVWSLDGDDPLEKGMAAHSSTLAWRIPRTEEPGGPWPMGSQRVGRDWAAKQQQGAYDFSPVQSSRSVVSDSLWSHESQHARPPCPSPTPGAYSSSRPLSRWHHPTISSSVVPFSSSLQSLPASGSFPMSQLFTSGGQRIGVSASASVLPMNIQDWFPLGRTGWISLQSKGLKSLLQHHSSKASILWRSAFFIVQVSHPYMTTGKPLALTRRTFVDKVMPLLFNMT